MKTPIKRLIERYAPRRLGVKIHWVLALFFVFALTVILLTLYVARQLEGGAAAINDAGSERMRSFAIGFHLHRTLENGPDTQGTAQAADLRRFMGEFAETLARLETGDPTRPLFLPREAHVKARMVELRANWENAIKPRVEKLLAMPPTAARQAALDEFDEVLQVHVTLIDELVTMVEHSNAHNTQLVYLLQNLLVTFSLLGTVLLVYLFHRLVIRPVGELHRGITRMSATDFAVRLPVQSADEIGELAGEFNRMAGRLQDFYATLEQRVEEKSRSIEEKNRELARRDKEMAVFEERNLLAQELHDSIAQSLAFLNIQVQMLQAALKGGQFDAANTELARMREGIQQSYDNVRELLVYFRLRIEDATLEQALAGALEKFEGQTGIRAQFFRSGAGEVPPELSAIQVLHIVQEALSNIRKHAKASRVEVELRADADALTIRVQDDGVGFDPARVIEEGGFHVGIGIMKERAHRIGARLEFGAAPGGGTAVILRLLKSPGANPGAQTV